MVYERHTKVFLEKDSKLWELQILPGYAFDVSSSVATYQYDSLRAKTGTWNERHSEYRKVSTGPITWNLTTYIRPFVADPANDEFSNSGYTHHCVEEALWANLVSRNTYDDTTRSWIRGLTSTTDELTIDFSESNYTKLQTFNLYYWLNYYGWLTDNGRHQVFKLVGCCVDKAVCKFSSSDLATIEWSGYAESIVSDTAGPSLTNVITEGKYSNQNYIMSKLSTMILQAYDSSKYLGVDGLGNFVLGIDDVVINFDNNISVYNTNNITNINTSSSHLLGSKEITGSFKAYLDLGLNHSRNLFKQVLEDEATTNDWEITFNLGGSGLPKVKIFFPVAQLDIPKQNFNTIVTTDVKFRAKIRGGITDSESIITYYGDITDIQHVPIEGTPSPSPSHSPSVSASSSPSSSPSVSVSSSPSTSPSSSSSTSPSVSISSSPSVSVSASPSTSPSASISSSPSVSPSASPSPVFEQDYVDPTYLESDDYIEVI